jgi:hypothetical protein
MTAANKKVTVRMLCIYSGNDVSVGPGETVDIDKNEAARLIAMGAAEDPSAGEQAGAIPAEDPAS